MGHPQSQWQNKKKYGNKIYSGHYRRDENNEREFFLAFKRKNGTWHIISAESHELIEKDGWRLMNPRTKQKTVRRKK